MRVELLAIEKDLSSFFPLCWSIDGQVDENEHRWIPLSQRNDQKLSSIVTTEKALRD